MGEEREISIVTDELIPSVKKPDRTLLFNFK